MGNQLLKTIIALGALTALIGGCKSGESDSGRSAAAPDRGAQPENKKPEAAEPAVGEFSEKQLAGATGQIFIKAVENFAPIVIEDSSGKLYSIGHCNKKWTVPVGTYEVSVTPGQFPQVAVGEIEVEQGEVAEAEVTGFGWIEVEAIENFAPIELVDASGERFSLGHCNKRWLAPVGTYQLEVKPGQYDTIELGKVTIEQGEVAEAEVTGFGWVEVEASETFSPVKLVAGPEVEFVLGHCNKRWVAPVGEYDVTVKGKKLDERITVEEGQTRTVASGL